MDSSASSQPTLRDLLRPLRAQRWVLVATVVLAVAASIAYSVTQKPKYTATAALQFQDETRDLGLVGIQVAPTSTPSQLASQAAQTIVQPAVVDRVKALLRSRLTRNQLVSSVSTSVTRTPTSCTFRQAARRPPITGAGQRIRGG